MTKRNNKMRLTKEELLGRAKKNIQRSDATLHEAARDLVEAIDGRGATQKECAEGVGKSEAWVSRLVNWYRDGATTESPFGPTTKEGRLAHAKDRMELGLTKRRTSDAGNETSIHPDDTTEAQPEYTAAGKVHDAAEPMPEDTATGNAHDDAEAMPEDTTRRKAARPVTSEELTRLRRERASAGLVDQATAAEAFAEAKRTLDHVRENLFPKMNYDQLEEIRSYLNRPYTGLSG